MARIVSEKTLQMIADREAGMTIADVARKHNVSRQAAQQVCAKYAPMLFVQITPAKCVYPIWRKWMNDNKVCKSELLRRMGNLPLPAASYRLSVWMRGEGYPQKETIDKLLAATGLTYEQLFYREGKP